MEKTLIRRWIKVFYTDIENTVINNGFSTDWIKPSAGVRQGCPLCPFLFVLTVEFMANKIRQSENVKGISICGNEVKLSQFADDINLVCTDLKSVENAVSVVIDFGSILGLSLNKEKTKAKWLGESANDRNAPLQLKWANGPTRFVGVFFFFFLSYDKKGMTIKILSLKCKKYNPILTYGDPGT